MQAHLRSGQRTRQQVIKKQRTNRMLMAVTAIFVGCWLPLNVIHLTFDYYEKVGLTRYYTAWSKNLRTFYFFFEELRQQ